MKINNDDLRSFAMAALNTYDLEGIEIDKKIALDSVEKEIIEDFADLNLEKTKTSRWKSFKVGQPEDYAEKLISLSEDKKVICGTRHRSCNPNLPFISCLPNFEIESKQHALSLSEEISDSFSVFEPIHLCFWSHKKVDADLYGSTYLVASREDVLSRGEWLSEKDMNLQEVKDESYYPWYEEGYKKFHLEMPEFEWKVTVNDLETMNESLDQGLLLESCLNGERVGLIAAVEGQFLGHPGKYFNEIFVSGRWKRKGLAKAMQRKFVLEKAKEKDIIWGTIDFNNAPSFKTALANGRKPIRFECFVQIDQRSEK